MHHQVATVLLLFTLSGPVKASTYLVRKILPCELVGAVATVWLKHLKVTIDYCHITLKSTIRATVDFGALLAKPTMK
jgi:hypothetical protein